MSKLALVRMYGVFALSIISLAACGGGGGSGGGNSKPSVPNAAVGGAWVGTDSLGNEILALSTETGRVHWVIPATGEQGFGTGSTNGNDVVINYTYVAPIGYTLNDGSTSASCTATGTIRARQSLILSTQCNLSSGGSFTNSATLNFDSLYNLDSSLTMVSGNYDDFGLVLTVSANGEIFEQDPSSGCVVNGQVSVINPSYNAYDVTYSFSNCIGSYAFLNGSTFTGLGILDTTVAPQQVTVGVTGTVSGITYSIVFTLPKL